MPALKQIASFGFVGALATLTHAGVGLSLHRAAGVAPLTANFVAFACAFCVSYLGQSRFTFPGSHAVPGALRRFATVQLLALGFNQAIVWLVTSAFGAPYWLALGVVFATVPALTFVAMKFWALRH